MSLENIKKSGAEASRCENFNIYFDCWKSEPKATELFRDKIGDKKELEWAMVVPEVNVEGTENGISDDYVQILTRRTVLQ